MAQYLATIRYTADTPCIQLADDAKGQPIAIRIDERIGGHLTVAIAPVDSKATSVEILWRSEGPDFDQMTPEDLKSFNFYRELGALFLPMTRPDSSAASPVNGETFRTAINNYLLKLSVESRRPDFYRALSYSRLDGDGVEMFAQVGEYRFTLGEHSVFIDSMRVLPAETLFISAARLKEISTSPARTHHSFLMAADRRFSEFSLGDAVVNLAQALEVAVYACVARQVESGELSVTVNENWHFHPQDVFLDSSDYNLNRTTKFKDAVYKDIEELWGARHEWVHNGRAKIRVFGELKNGKYGANKKHLKDLLRTDYSRFRSAVSAALVWMGEMGLDRQPPHTN